MRSPGSLRHKQSSNFDEDEVNSEAKFSLERAIYETGGVKKRGGAIINKTHRNEMGGALSPEVTFNHSGNKLTLMSFNPAHASPHKYGVTMVQSPSGSMSTSP